MKEIFVAAPAKLLNNSLIFYILLSSCLLLLPSIAYSQPIMKASQQALTKELQKKQYISIVFASQNLNHSVSAFGHTLLLFHHSINPAPHSLAVEYLGRIDTPFFIIRSLLGTIPGQFRIRPWSQKLWEYEQEDRNIWIMPLKLTQPEKLKIHTLIQNSIANRYSYNFLFTNCSWRIFKILKDSMDNMNCSVKFYTLPIDTLRALYKCNKLRETSSFLYRPAQAVRLNQAFKQLNKNNKLTFKKNN